MVFVAMKGVLQWKRRVAYYNSILSPIMLKFNRVTDVSRLNNCTKFQLILTRNGGEIAYSLVAMVNIFMKIHFE